MSTNIRDFYTSFTTEDKFFINLPVFWTVTIDGIDKSNINKVLTDAGEKWAAKISPFEMTKHGNILVAQEVTIPSESSDYVAVSNIPTGGYLPSYAMTERSNFLSRSFTINIMETQTDLEHNFFRPWQIAMGIHGLIASPPDLRAMIEVKQFSNGGKFIKGFKFHRAFPTVVEGFTLNYENTDIPMKTITFGCDNYIQL